MTTATDNHVKVVESFFEIHRWDIRATGDEVVGILDATFASHTTGKKLDIMVVELSKFTDGLISDATIFPQDTRAIHELALAD